MPPVKPTTSPAQQIVMVAFFALVLLPLAGPKFVAGQIEREKANYVSVLGEEWASAVLSRSDAWFRNAFVNTGMVQKSLNVDAPAEGASARPPTPAAAPTPRGQASPMPAKKSLFAPPDPQPKTGTPQPSSGPLTASADNPVKKIGRHWMGGAWSITYLMLCRLSILLWLLPLLVPMIAIVLIDGGARRKSKWYAFGGSDPKRYVIGLRLGAWSALFVVFALVSPGSLPGLAIPALMVLSATGFAMWVANQQKPM